MISVTKEMKQALETERRKRLLDSIPETVRVLLSEHLSQKTANYVNEAARAK